MVALSKKTCPRTVFHLASPAAGASVGDSSARVSATSPNPESGRPSGKNLIKVRKEFSTSKKYVPNAKSGQFFSCVLSVPYCVRAKFNQIILAGGSA